MKRKIFGAGLAGMALLASGAAHAATRSADVIPANAPVSAVQLDRASADARTVSEMGAEAELPLILLIALGLIGGLILALDSNDSPG